MSNWRYSKGDGAFLWEQPAMTHDDLALRNEEIDWLIREGRRDWQLINGRIAKKGDPTMSLGVYMGIGAIPPPAALSMAAALSATEAAGITNANQPIYVPLLGNAIQAPMIIDFMIQGRYTVTTTPGSLITSMRLGNANSSPLLGTSGSVALTASLTNAFVRWLGRITIVSVGVPGANAKAIGVFEVNVNTAVGGAYNTAMWATSGGTPVSFDSTLTALGGNGGALWLGLSDTGATNHATVTLDQVHWIFAN